MHFLFDMNSKLHAVFCYLPKLRLQALDWKHLSTVAYIGGRSGARSELEVIGTIQTTISFRNPHTIGQTKPIVVLEGRRTRPATRPLAPIEGFLLRHLMSDMGKPKKRAPLPKYVQEWGAPD